MRSGVEGTRGTETSKYPEEKKKNIARACTSLIPLVAVSEKGGT